MRSIIHKYFYAVLLMLLLPSAQAVADNELPSYCREDPVLAGELSGMGPVLGLGSSVSHGLMARSASEIVAEQLCFDNTGNGHAFPWFLPLSYPRIVKHYYRSMKPKLVIALDATYHKMKILEDTEAKKRELETLVAGLALDCAADFYDCSANGNESYVISDGYTPTVLLGDIFYE
ncbi:MAG: hypothetical protein GY757_30675, partial [bacterium]|nr:hypothetical protein [bacterium]